MVQLQQHVQHTYGKKKNFPVFYILVSDLDTIISCNTNASVVA